MGLSRRQLRLLMVSGFSLFLMYIMYSSKGDNPSSLSDSRESANSIISANPNAKIDEAINNKISKLYQQEQAEKAAEEKAAVDAAAGIKVTEEIDAIEEDFDPVKELMQIRALAPMIVFSKSYCPYSKRLKKLLTEHYEITPSFFPVELDKHKHGKLLQEHLAKISGRATVPNVLIGTSNESKGGCDDFLNLHESGKLATMLNEWGNKKLSVKRLETPSNV
ncbi:hypothetical protein PSN45_000530 [Yamadazyma tenuis]|uniref:Thioredoxin-like protein n=1 Tax=Candida tenuis (strain ATCC 10573 / BCRC 21748 / CBS 615 / JCM 9827 / NBRC 10315 / NRRL Y-1498 / VKM Y-70) TaxID=590646 RepID=G3B993_CANTC|nr:uncharacterized protein CANTEDRAFT_125063 [Yamadazyma tenuis ATCC 10573]XP_006688011.1 thioredoxin-like protein [Yamadazyma tenuis ATCC 10573]EGV61840.1 hypothetical protein CANTEDRAFT_125063 [Yamadazyma tenuis ATCC 10573]EGV61841.1 thioredoxin-like protein [Yamadazyma tenuis ATCC 10573]WEJ93070.1 hypothetical protein PSN45_000530 [Yamadazyma tenuis]